jgi:peptidoglycan/xylan/chitin deacetylase (PgdA/CDA1 family)
MSRHVSILAFHGVGPGPPPLFTDIATFERQIFTLCEAGYVALELAEVARRLRARQPFPTRAVALTFDDGYESVHRHALPLLDRAGFTATVFPVTSALGATNSWDPLPDDREPYRLLDKTQLRELLEAGWTVGNHTHTHPRLSQLPPPQIAAEIDTANSILEDLCDRAVTVFAYPFGVHDAPARTVASERFAMCVTIGAQRATMSSPTDRVPRIDAWYLQHRVAAKHVGDPLGGAYLRVRQLARSARRLLERDRT